MTSDDQADTVAASPDGVGQVVARGAATGESLPEPRTVGADDYQLGAELARGGMGRIIEAVDRRHDRPVAIKLLLRDDAAARARFAREAAITARLQHPAIVPVYEIGRWSTGEPFFAMKLVRGRSLDRVIAAAGRTADRLALLPNLIAVSEALAYAHGRRIIHRDLKPHNVLCGDFGETVVIDWGLAKELDGPEPEATGEASSGSADLTAAGQAMGTPSYMAPEQARGDRVDERTDVYALGALLYHVLAGAAPYRGATTAETMALVLKGPPPPLGERAPDAPRDLVTLVGKAMARDPAERYASAAELAEELRRFAAGRLVAAHDYSAAALVRRFVRRHRAAVAVAALLLAVLAATSAVGLRRIVRESDRADRMRAVAETRSEVAVRQRAAAEELVDFILRDLRARLTPIGKLDLLAGVGGRIEAYYAAIGSDDVATRTRRAAALSLVGAVAELQDDLAGAERAYRAALALRVELAWGGDQAEPQRALAQAHASLAGALRARNDLPGALAEYRAALVAAERAVALAPDALDPQKTLAGVYSATGELLELMGEPVQALGAHRTSLAMARRLVERAPTDQLYQRQLGIALLTVGWMEEERGDGAAGLALMEESLALERARQAAAPDDAGRRFDLADAWIQLARLHKGRGHFPEALAAFAENRALLETLLRIEPDHADWLYWLGENRIDVGAIRVTLGQFAEAEAEFEAARLIAVRRAAAAPNDGFAQFQVYEVHLSLGEVTRSRGDPAGTLRHYRAALPIAARLLAAAPTNVRWRFAVTRTHRVLADAHRARGERAPALAAYRASLAAAEPLVATDPDNPLYQEAIGIACAGVAGLVAREPGGAVEGRAMADRARAILARLAAADKLEDDGRAALASLD